MRGDATMNSAITQSNIKEYLCDNPKENEIFREHLNFYFPKWISNKKKHQTLSTLPQGDVEFLFQSILLTCISENDINRSKGDEGYRAIMEIYEKALRDENNELLSQIPNIYANNLEAIKINHNDNLYELKYSKLPKKKKEQVDALINENKSEIANKVINEYYKSNTSNALGIEDRVSSLGWDFFDPQIFTVEALKLNPSWLEQVVCAVYNPALFLSPDAENPLNDALNLPCEWYLSIKLTFSEYKDFARKTTGTTHWNRYFNSAIQSIREQMKSPVSSIKGRESLIKEVLENLDKKMYQSALIVSFTLIEGLLWELSYIINKEKEIYHEGKLFDIDNNCYFESTRIRDMLERTHAKDYLNDGFLKYFCKELYEERNLVLHGKNLCEKCNEFAMCIMYKIFTLDYVLVTINNFYEQGIFNIFDKAVDKEKINELIDVFFE